MNDLNPNNQSTSIDAVSSEDSTLTPKLEPVRYWIAYCMGLCGFLFGLLPSIYVAAACVYVLIQIWVLNIRGGFWGAEFARICSWMLAGAIVISLGLAGLARAIGNAKTARPALYGAMIAALAFVCLFACTLLARAKGFTEY